MVQRQRACSSASATSLRAAVRRAAFGFHRIEVRLAINRADVGSAAFGRRKARQLIQLVYFQSKGESFTLNRKRHLRLLCDKHDSKFGEAPVDESPREVISG